MGNFPSSVLARDLYYTTGLNIYNVQVLEQTIQCDSTVQGKICVGDHFFSLADSRMERRYYLFHNDQVDR